MKPNQNLTSEAVENFFRKLKQTKRKRIIECSLPTDAVLFLFEHTTALRIDMLVEKRSKDDYVIIEIEEDNQRVYLFQHLLDELRRRFSYDSGSILLAGFQNHRITNLIAKLKAL
jgi:hypothetical protein